MFFITEARDLLELVTSLSGQLAGEGGASRSEASAPSSSNGTSSTAGATPAGPATHNSQAGRNR